MKVALIVNQGTLGNTKRLAEDMGKNHPEFEMFLLKQAPDNLRDYDLIGFGSAPYAFKWPLPMIKYIERVELNEGTKCFFFSTSASGKTFYGKAKKAAKNRGLQILGKFAIYGHMKLGKIETGKKHPNEKDFAKAEKKLQNILGKIK